LTPPERAAIEARFRGGAPAKEVMVEFGLPHTSAKDTDSMLRIEFTDVDNEAVALHVCRGVVEYVENPDRYYREHDFTLILTRETWAKLYLDQATVKQLAEAGALTITGDPPACDRLLGLFDPFTPAQGTDTAGELDPHRPK
jgi:alkyl sulfatase BDS1-like metallo-beta-lactamase superfamily hydrolase